MLRPPQYVWPDGTPVLFKIVNTSVAAAIISFVALGVGFSFANRAMGSRLMEYGVPPLVVLWGLRTALLVWYGKKRKVFRK